MDGTRAARRPRTLAVARPSSASTRLRRLADALDALRAARQQLSGDLDAVNHILAHAPEGGIIWLQQLSDDQLAALAAACRKRLPTRRPDIERSGIVMSLALAWLEAGKTLPRSPSRSSDGEDRLVGEFVDELRARFKALAIPMPERGIIERGVRAAIADHAARRR